MHQTTSIRRVEGGDVLDKRFPCFIKNKNKLLGLLENISPLPDKNCIISFNQEAGVFAFF